MTTLLINKPVNLRTSRRSGDSKPIKRLWLEGKKLLGLVPIGAKLALDDRQDRLVATYSQAGTRTVSSRKDRFSELSLPLIEIDEGNSAFVAGLEDDAMLRYTITETSITVTVLQDRVRTKQIARETDALNTILRGEPLRKATLFSGGACFDFCLHDGFERSGLASAVALAVDLEEHCIDNIATNAASMLSPDALLVASDIALLNVDNQLPQYHCLSVTPPCVEASIAGKASNGNTGETSRTAHLVYYYSRLIDQFNPIVFMMENVQAFSLEPSYKSLCGLLTHLGYTVQERVINAYKEGFSLEARERLFMVAISNGMSDMEFDLADVKCIDTVPQTLGEIMEDIPADSSRWSPKTGLVEKQARDIKKKNGFRMQVYTAKSLFINTLRKGYQKSGSSDPLIAHPKKALFRILSAVEHARVKMIPESLFHGVSEGKAHSMLGNGVIGSIGRAIGYALGLALQAWANKRHMESQSQMAA
ncbi:DNA cytosine methyltransferase [Vibrio splendidus]